MGLRHAIFLENSIHRGSVTPSDLEHSFAAFDLMADRFWLFFCLALCHFNDRLRFRINGHLHSVAGRNRAGLRAQGRIPSQELISRQAGILGEGKQVQAIVQFDCLERQRWGKLQFRKVLIDVLPDFYGGQKLRVKVFGGKTPVGVAIVADQIQ